MDKNTNPNDYKVVSFHNNQDFTFTPEMGCMYDGRAITGQTGVQGIGAGETVTLPYHIGHRLATNLAKIVMVKGNSGIPQLDAMGQPIVKAIWNETELERLKNSFLTELYSEVKPATMSETDKLMAKVEEYKAMVDTLIKKDEVIATNVEDNTTNVGLSSTYLDKAEVIAELTKRNIKFDARKNKAELEKLIV